MAPRAPTVAGLWDQWRDRATGEILSPAPITEPNKFTGQLYDRMPGLLPEKDFVPWLSGDAGAELFKPARDKMLQRWPVSKRVNSSRAPADDPTLSEPVELHAERMAAAGR